MMETIASLIVSLFENAEIYVKTNIDLFKLKIIDKLADVVSNLAATLILAVLAVLVAFIFNIGLALWIGEILGKSYYGFFALAGFYALLTVLLYFFRVKLIKDPINNTIITKMQKEASL